MGVRQLAAAFGTVASAKQDRKSTRLNSSHTEIYTLSLHDALPIFGRAGLAPISFAPPSRKAYGSAAARCRFRYGRQRQTRSEEHTSELQSHRDLHSFPTRRSSDLWPRGTSAYLLRTPISQGVWECGSSLPLSVRSPAPN